MKNLIHKLCIEMTRLKKEYEKAMEKQDARLADFYIAKISATQYALDLTFEEERKNA